MHMPLQVLSNIELQQPCELDKYRHISVITLKFYFFEICDFIHKNGDFPIQLWFQIHTSVAQDVFG